MDKDPKEDLKTEPTLDGSSVEEIEKNLDRVVDSVNEFVEAMTECYTAGNVNHNEFRTLRNAVTTDSLYFLTHIVPYFKSALISCKEFFDFITGITLEDFYECREDILDIGSTADEEFQNMLLITQYTQGVFKKRSVQAENLLTALNTEKSKLEEENHILSQKKIDLGKTRITHYIPIASYFAKLNDKKNIEMCDNEIFGNKKSIFIVVEAMNIIKTKLTDAINNFYTAIKELSIHFSHLKTDSSTFLQQCEKDPKSMKSLRTKGLFFEKIVGSSKSISNKIKSIIGALDVMYGDMIGLDSLKGEMNHVELWKAMFKSEDSESLEAVLKELGVWNRIVDFLKKEKKKIKSTMQAIKNKK